MNKSYDLNDFLPHSQIISDLAYCLWDKNSQHNNFDKENLYLKIPMKNFPPNAIFMDEDEYILIPEGTPLKLLMQVYLRNLFNTPRDKCVAIVSIGDFTMTEDYTPKPQYCYATLYYNYDRTLANIDFSFEDDESSLNLKFD